ncbi:type II toxin-antitoxin system HigB family toxin [Rufibacter sediminis]|uniref:Type II toxin-antitoxin system HigB family toxin n=1 Tax=Rufibacter sediminis TaxID=2762756 RepID=A0ABR6W091_9BACT|nr:type II toxin-antitoxin system HigB family toxin [Rufibacter sediminis]MBC3542437.1 type II toxin-antitoxin system HigB family toxin [Rufibacter sediminis]
MNVISLKKLKEYYTQHAGAKIGLTAWFKTTKKAEWKDLNGLKADFPSADLVKDDRVVFNIKGNHYRLIARISFQYKNVMVKWIGTHAEYDKIDAGTV